jgi:hypothetical protein
MPGLIEMLHFILKNQPRHTESNAHRFRLHRSLPAVGKVTFLACPSGGFIRLR